MSSLKWPARVGPDADAMLEAVSLVAERNFFSVAEPCDADRFASMSAEAGSPWMVATVDFTEADCAGEVFCTMPQALAHALFDAFSGRDPSEPPPEPDRLVDLVGEFANMICGSWLTRLASHQTFALGRPAVRPAPAGSPIAGWHAPLLLAVNDLPLAVGARVAATRGAALHGAGA